MITILSQLKGAEVLRASDGARAGKTPWTTQHPASSGEAKVTLRLKGYRPTTLVVKLNQDRTISAVLECANHRASTIAATPAAENTQTTHPVSPAPPKRKNGLAADPFAN